MTAPLAVKATTAAAMLGVGRRQLGINLRHHPERVLALVMGRKG